MIPCSDRLQQEGKEDILQSDRSVATGSREEAESGMSTNLPPVEVFYSYADADGAWLDELEKHLHLLQREGLILPWHKRHIGAGRDWKKTLDEHLNTASVILLLISADFMASDYCYGIEMQRAMERQEAGEARVIPIVLRPTEWQSAPFATLQALPSTGVPITRWNDQDAAFVDVAQGIRAAVRETHHLAFGAPSPHLPRLWNIPYARNPVFTGREEVLARLAGVLKTGQLAAISQPQAVSGLGGIGKTQIAVEYSYQYQQDYQSVFWTLADTREALVSGYGEIAHLLNLAQKDEHDQTVAVKAVLHWFKTHGQWLLILDNADELALVREFLPSTFGGHILLTTRAHSLGRLARCLEVVEMHPDVGTLLLLRRANLVAQDASLEEAVPSDVTIARAITEELGGLPLALDQAGAYIEETSSSLAAYLHLYHTRKAELLSKRGGLVEDHHESVATTWSLSLQRVEEKNPAAAELARFCAYLAPDAIPETIMLTGAEHLGPLLQPFAGDLIAFNQAIAALSAYSLMRRDRTEQTMSMHRLVQVVLRENMPIEEGHQWKQRAVLAVHTACPDVTDVKQWGACEQWLPHALACAAWIEQGQMRKPEAARLLNQAGYYLGERGRYREAEPLVERALAICEQELGGQHPNTATSLNNLAMLYQNQGKYGQAELLVERALAIYEQELGASHPKTASSLNNLAELYRSQGKYGQAEPLYERALAICEQVFGSQHPTTQTIQANYTSLLQKMKQSESPDQETAE